MMTFYRPTSAPMPFYGGDYRPDDEPPPEAVLEEKRILEHQFRRPSPSRLSSTSSSIRPPTAVRQGGGISANRSLRARPSGSSPRRSLQRSSAFGNRRSTTITDRGRTASMPAVPIVRIEMFFIQYNQNNLSLKLFGSSILDSSLIILPSFGNVPRPDGPVLEEYRLRSFSITASGVCNLGDFVRYASPPSSTRHHQPVGKRESCPASVSGTPSHQQNANGSSAAATAAAAAATSHTVCTEFSRFRKPSTALTNKFKANDTVESYKVALLGAPGVGKTTISVQFSTSDYICVYDTSIDEDCACRTIRVMINGQEAELTIIDIPYVEMSIETLCSTYNPNVFIVMYSVVDERSFDMAEQMLLFLWKGEYIHTRGVILVGNKSDLERTRKIQTNVGRNLAYSWNCKFIETSSGIDHNVDKLLVGILAQIKLNPLRERMYNSKRKKYSVTKLYKDFLAYLRGVKSSENLFSI
ncbi:GTP-binding protein REM 1-like isoform X1 [Metopolophium dirhodum]|uniref:GTP-binding protein REM 1-like isoform X1 n=1 Tax=Metopolophium dirhodum TaxID=44670 RepID=UPI00298FE876|nr:GTP-binding protein REM 1-like isoform X1 [Metopolophium dirhodum]